MSVLGRPGLNNLVSIDIESQQRVDYHENSVPTWKKVTIVATAAFTAISLSLLGYGGYQVYDGLMHDNIFQCAQGAAIIGMDAATSFIAGIGVGWLTSNCQDGDSNDA